MGSQTISLVVIRLEAVRVGIDLEEVVVITLILPVPVIVTEIEMIVVVAIILEKGLIGYPQVVKDRA